MRNTMLKKYIYRDYRDRDSDYRDSDYRDNMKIYRPQYITNIFLNADETKVKAIQRRGDSIFQHNVCHSSSSITQGVLYMSLVLVNWKLQEIQKS